MFKFINSRTAIAGAIIGLLLAFLFRRRDFCQPYDVTTTSNLLFVHLLMQFHLKFVRDVIFRFQWSEFLFIRVIEFLVTLDLPLSKMTSSL